MHYYRNKTPIIIVLLIIILLISCHHDYFSILTHNDVGYWKAVGYPRVYVKSLKNDSVLNDCGDVIMAFSKNDSVMKYLNEDMTPCRDEMIYIKYGRRFKFSGDTMFCYVRTPYKTIIGLGDTIVIYSISKNRIILGNPKVHSVTWIRCTSPKSPIPINIPNNVEEDAKASTLMSHCGVNKQVFSNKHLIPGMFSVSKDKEVQFTRGNLYWDGANYHFEANQFDCPNNSVPGTKWNAHHISHFYWSSNEESSRAVTCTETVPSGSDCLWCNIDKKITVDDVSGLYVITAKEWYYLLFSRKNAINLYKCGVTVCGKPNCLVIAPDDYKGKLSQLYDKKSWAAAEETGLVCFPTTGCRSEYNLSNGGVDGCYLCDLIDSEKGILSSLYFCYGLATIKSKSRNEGYAIRLVR